MIAIVAVLVDVLGRSYTAARLAGPYPEGSDALSGVLLVVLVVTTSASQRPHTARTPCVFNSVPAATSCRSPETASPLFAFAVVPLAVAGSAVVTFAAVTFAVVALTAAEALVIPANPTAPAATSTGMAATRFPRNPNPNM